MAKTQPISAQFDVERPCKHSVRYKAHDERAKQVATVIYLMNETVDALGKPKSITLTVSAN